jgi:hypothetical protein
MTYTVRLTNVTEIVDSSSITVKSEFLNWLDELGLIVQKDYTWDWGPTTSMTPNPRLISFDLTFNDQNLATLCKLTWG